MISPDQWRREPGRAPGQHNSLAPLPAYPSPRPRKTAKPEGPRGPGAPVDFPPFFKRMHYSPEMCLCVCRYSVVTIMPSVARPTFFLGGPPPPLIKILDPPLIKSWIPHGVFAFLPGPPDTRAPGRWPPLPPPPLIGPAPDRTRLISILLSNSRLPAWAPFTVDAIC